MIGHAILGKVPGANTFAAIAGADQGAPLLCSLFVQLLVLALEKSATQNTQRSLIVFVLAAFVLTLHFEFFGRPFLVPDANRALGLVDMLSTRAASAHALP